MAIYLFSPLMRLASSADNAAAVFQLSFLNFYVITDIFFIINSQISNQEAMDIVMQSSSRDKKLKGSSPAKKDCVYHCASVSPSSHSPRSKRIFHSKIEDGDDPSTSRVSLATTAVKVRTQFLNNENDDVLGEKSSNSGILSACKELVNLAVARGSLDDITVMIVDLDRYR